MENLFTVVVRDERQGVRVDAFSNVNQAIQYLMDSIDDLTRNDGGWDHAVGRSEGHDAVIMKYQILGNGACGVDVNPIWVLKYAHLNDRVRYEMIEGTSYVTKACATRCTKYNSFMDRLCVMVKSMTCTEHCPAFLAMDEQSPWHGSVICRKLEYVEGRK